MKISFKSIVLCTAILLGFNSLGQTTKNAQVIGVIPLGSSEYSILLEDNSDNYFKTSPHPTGELVSQQLVQLEYAQNQSEQVEVLASSLTSALYAQLVTQDPSGNSTPPNYTLPTLENGILFFQDQQHLLDVYDVLTDFTEYGELQEQLDIVEGQYIGFESYRTWFNIKYDWRDGIHHKQEFDDIVKKDFICDEIKKTMLNKHLEIGVGDSIYYFHDLGLVLAIEKTDSVTLSAFQEIEREDDPFVGDSPLFEHYFSYRIATGDLFDYRGSIDVDDDLTYTTLFQLGAENCDPFTKYLRVSLQEEYSGDGEDGDPLLYGSDSTFLTIDWGDGSPEETVDYYNHEHIEHVFPDFGVYYVETEITFKDRNGDVQTITDGTGGEGEEDVIFVVDIACTKNDVLQSSSVQGSGSSWIIHCQIWVNNNIMGSHVGSSTDFFKVHPGGGLEPFKATIWTEIWGTFRNSICGEVDSKHGDKLRKKRHQIQKVKSKVWKWFRIGTEDIHSYHYFVKDGVFADLELILDPC